jgi:hypothetical protein
MKYKQRRECIQLSALVRNLCISHFWKAVNQNIHLGPANQSPLMIHEKRKLSFHLKSMTILAPKLPYRSMTASSFPSLSVHRMCIADCSTAQLDQWPAWSPVALTGNLGSRAMHGGTDNETRY